MPKPKPGEKRKDYVKRCIPIVLKDGTAKDRKQAIAVCNSMFEKEKKVKNERKMTSNVLETFTANIDGPKVREETLDGRKFLVAPLVMMVEGVAEGSQGPLLYPESELEMWSPAWNHKPIVNYHPEDEDGEMVTANSPKVLEKSKLGFLLNTVTRGGKQRAEAWFDELLTREKEPRVLEALQKRRKMEVSTGLFLDIERKSSSFRGKDYVGIARNHRPDHLAMLPDKIGACSINDGAGLLANQKRKKKRRLLSNGETKMSKRDKKKIVDDLIANKATKFDEKNREWLMTLNEDQLVSLEPVLDQLEKKGVVDGGGKKKTAAEEAAELGTGKPEVEGAKNEGNKKPDTGGKKKLTLNEFLEDAPEELRHIIVEGIQTRNAEREELIQTIIANASSIYTAEQLTKKDLPDLRALAKLASAVGAASQPEQMVPSFFGAATPVGNVGKGYVEEPYVSPAMDFSQK